MRGDMIETYKILTKKYDKETSPKLELAKTNHLRGNKLKLQKIGCKINLRLHSFPLRIINIWNSLQNLVIKSPTVNTFKNRLDKCWTLQDLKFNYRAN